MPQLASEQEPLMGTKPSSEGPLQLGNLVPQPAVHQPGHLARSSPGAQQFRQQAPCRDSRKVADHRGQLDVRTLQCFLEPIYFRGTLSHQARPIAGEFAQLPFGALGYETPREQPVLQEVSDPLAVRDVRFPSRDPLYMLGVDQQQVESVFEQVIDRLPVHPAALHGHMGAACLQQPVRELQQIVRHSPEASDLFARPPIRPWGDQTRRHDLLVDVQPTAALVHDVHPRRLPRSFETTEWGVQSIERLLCVLTGNSLWYLGTPGPNCLTGSRHQAYPAS